MKLTNKTLLVCVTVAIFVGAIFNVRAQSTHYLNAQLPDGTPTQIDLANPIGTEWHEIYPTYCIVSTLTSWNDNGDKKLSASDEVDFNDVPTYYHVDQVLTTIHWTWKEGGPGTDPTVYSASETEYLGDYLEGVSPDPAIQWHQIYPPDDFSRTFRITSHEDTDGDGLINPSEQFDLTYDDNGEVRWAHLDAISTDIIVSDTNGGLPEFPFGLELGLGLGLAAAIIFVAWKRRPISPKKL